MRSLITACLIIFVLSLCSEEGVALRIQHLCRVLAPPKVLSGLAALSILSDASVVHAQAGEKLTNLDSSSISKIVSDDISVRQALITADFTRDIYDESCTFQDEIDTYPIDKYVTGTKALFNAAKSHVDLTSAVTADANLVQFKFDEVLAFNIPFNPKVSLTGRVVLTRGDNGLIVKSREFWDQSVPTVLSTVKF